MHLLAQTLTSQPAHDFSFYALLSSFYGIVEGLTEFLPISSTAHLRIAEKFTGIEMESGYWKMYSVVIQLGAILSVPLLFRHRIMQLLRTFPKGDPQDDAGLAPPLPPASGEAPVLTYAPPSRQKTILTHPLSLVIIGFLVTAGPCYYADKKIGKNLENLTFMAYALIIGGIVMWLVDTFCKRARVHRMEQMSVLDAIWIGLVQILSAVFPGTSRSMSTIAAGEIFGLDRPTAVEYSFFLSIPTMFAATGYKLLQALVSHKTAEEAAAYNAPPGQWAILAIGFVVSFLVAWVVNKWFILWVQRHGFTPFAIYRVLFGAALLAYVSKTVG